MNKYLKFSLRVKDISNVSNVFRLLKKKHFQYICSSVVAKSATLGHGITQDPNYEIENREKPH